VTLAPDASRLRSLARRIKRIVKPGALILGYHRVIDLPSDPYSIAVPPRLFAEQLEALRAYANPMSLRRMVAHLRAGRVPPRAVALTFDDGYFDALAYARPLLEQHDVPATVFAISGFIGGSRELWWDELAHILHDAPAEQFDRIYRQANGMAPDARERLFARLRKETAPAVRPRDLYRGMTPGELCRLAEGNLVEVGAHTVTHPWLPKLTAEEQRAEVRGSRAQLETILGHSVTSFSYPHGQVSGEVVSEVRNAGFEYACSSAVDLARPASPLFQLPRVQVRSVDGDEFSARLRFWFEGK
jgi:peptidoglycan/xylan/chitin deacetylase (PgdA/CDA1 family)